MLGKSLKANALVHDGRLAAGKYTSVALVNPEPSQYLPVVTARILTLTLATPDPPTSEVVPQTSPAVVEHPAFQLYSLYEVAAGKVNATSGLVVSITQVKLSGVLSRLPALSNARTLNVWLPSASPEYVAGLVQVSQEPASSLHSVRATPEATPPEVGSTPVKENDAPVRFVGSAGCPEIDEFGSVVSITQVKLSGVLSRLPALSNARTLNVWLPSASPEYVAGLVQVSQEPASSLHSVRATPEATPPEVGSTPVKENDAPVRFVGSAGCAEIDEFGSVVSITQVKLSGVLSRLPALSNARTLNVWLPSASPEYVAGLVQVSQEPASSLHSVRATPEATPPEVGSTPVKENDAPVRFVGSVAIARRSTSPGSVVSAVSAERVARCCPGRVGLRRLGRVGPLRQHRRVHRVGTRHRVPQRRPGLHQRSRRVGPRVDLRRSPSPSHQPTWIPGATERRRRGHSCPTRPPSVQRHHRVRGVHHERVRRAVPGVAGRVRTATPWPV